VTLKYSAISAAVSTTAITATTATAIAATTALTAGHAASIAATTATALPLVLPLPRQGIGANIPK
jgi:V8-like Glu-specific endopeptidase